MFESILEYFRQSANFAHATHRLLTFRFFQTIEVDIPVKMVGLMLQHSTHEASSFKNDRFAVEIDAPYTGIISAPSLIPKFGNRKTTFFSILLSPSLLYNWVEHVTELAIDII